MFNETIKLVEEVRKGTKLTEKYLNEAKAVRDELNRELANARKRLERKRSSEYFPQKLASSIIKGLKDGNQLETELDLAIDKAITDSGSEEWGHDVYKSALYKVANNKDIYKLNTTGSGWNIRLAPRIVFEEEAGTLSDYAAGITKYRETDLKSKTGEADSDRGLKATNWWLAKVYGGSLMTKTLKSRLSYSGRTAPFWQLLNSGSVGMASDRPDGSYNPFPSAPTDFIGNAERAIKTLFLTSFLPEAIKWTEETIKFGEEVEALRVLRDGVSEDINKLKVDYRQNQRIYDSLGKKKRYADEDKIAKAAQKYRAGEEFERVLISKKGSPNKFYLTKKMLEGLI